MRPNVPQDGRSTSSGAVVVVIPARMASTRLPGKPLAMIGDAPMIVQVMRRARDAGFGADEQSRVVVACDDQAIADAVTAHGGEAIMSRPDHPSGSDRVEEALERIDPQGKFEYVINLQGDLPEIDARILPMLVTALEHDGADIATPVAPARADEVPLPQVVKAAISFADGKTGPGAVGKVLYFSRHPIPYGGKSVDTDRGTETPIWHHVGIYAWRRAALRRFVSLPPSPLEMAEKLEQLRALENGMRISALVVDSAPGGIDTPEDLEQARARIQKNVRGNKGTV